MCGSCLSPGWTQGGQAALLLIGLVGFAWRKEMVAESPENSQGGPVSLMISALTRVILGGAGDPSVAGRAY